MELETASTPLRWRSGRAAAAVRLTAAPPWVVAAIVLLGSALVLPRLGEQSLWVDEGLTIGPALAAHDAGDLVRRVRAADTQPPASHLVLYALRDTLPRSEFFFRLPSFLAIEAAIVVFYLVVARLWGPAVGVGWVALAQVSPFLALFAAEARNYGLWLLAVALSWYAFVRWHQAARSPGGARSVCLWALLWACVNGAGLWLHVFHVFSIAAQGAIVLALAVGTLPAERSRRYLAVAAAAQALAVASFVPWLAKLAQSAPGEIGVQWTRPFSLATLAYQVFALHFGASLGPDLREIHTRSAAALLADHAPALLAAAAAIALTALAFALAVGGALRDRGRRWELLPLVVVPVVGLLGPLAYAARAQFPLHPRHLLFVWPLLPLVLALAAVRRPRLRPAVVAAALLQALALGNLLYNDYYAKDDERGAVRFAEARSGPRTYVLGDVAPYYCAATRGRSQSFIEFAPDAEEIWLVDNRQWEPEKQRFRARLEGVLTARGFSPAGTYEQFRGIVLRHWTRSDRPTRG